MDKIGTLLCALAALLAGGCRGRHTTGAQPSLRVEVIEAATDTVPNRMSFVSSVESNFDALIEPRVNGYLVNKYFSSGMPVRKGQLLFTIDPNLLSTTLLSAEASLESARAQEVSARNNYERAVPLARIDAISQSQLDQYTAQWKAAEAGTDDKRICSWQVLRLAARRRAVRCAAKGRQRVFLLPLAGKRAPVNSRPHPLSCAGKR